MFDMLTRDDLYALHTKLHDEGLALHLRFMALPSPLSVDAAVLMAKHAEIGETMRAVDAEIDRREQETREEAVINQSIYRALGGQDESAGARGLRDLRNQRGIDA